MIYDEPPGAHTKRPRKVSSHVVREPPAPTGKQTSRKTGPRASTGINLREVAEVLESYGLDPTVEFAKVLMDPEALDPEVRARMCLEILQYVRPKLKAIEIRQDKPIEMVVRWATE